MNCWKSVNLYHYYGDLHVIHLAIITVISSYITFYIPFSFLVDIQSLNDNDFLLFIILSFCIYPIHKMIHVCTLLSMKSKFLIRWKRFYQLIPLINIKITVALVKWKYIFALLMPFFILNSILIVCIFLFPSYVHYMTLLLSLHNGICIRDMIYLKLLLKSPTKCFIEENDEGYEILTLSTNL
ncbi:DUF3267 domain-containing protein [Bacillus andreraoultii]|uniref:DUF3267 domain-containing protein n=1 Tax=Bacillus andreraoultii TaxID=1499685 RepID=UPI00053B63B3|nr:DUF3267 domain-containing protein [Bacillus andreraoultii]